MAKNAKGTNSNDSKNCKQNIDVWNLTADICLACLDGDYQSCYCDTGERPSLAATTTTKSNNDNCSSPKISISRLDLNSNHGTLDQTDFPTGLSCDHQQTTDELNSSGSYTQSINGEYISDNEFEDAFLSGGIDTHILPPSVTDWNTIDSILSDELVPEEHDITVTSSKSTCANTSSESVRLQMVFVDSESDKDSVPDVEVYYDDHKDFLSRSSGSCSSERNVESRDSGYVTGDVYEMNIVEHVTDCGAKTRRSSLEPAEEATRLLASLRIHEELEEKRLQELEERRQQEYDNCHQLKQKNIAELRMLKECLELQVAHVNIELLEELSLRDELHSQHQALLVNADDIAKAADQTDSNNVISSACSERAQKKAKRRSFWWT